MKKNNDYWNKILDDLKQEFRKISEEKLSNKAITLLNRWMNEELFENQHEPVMFHIKEKKFDLLLDSFYQFIPFGTGGRRGRVGFGSNRINDITVAMSVQGHCDFIKNNPVDGKSESVVIACDVRKFKDLNNTYSFIPEKKNPLLNMTSRHLSKIAAEIYTANNIKCYFLDPDSEEGYLSTPELSFLIRRLGTIGGINISASHNHPDDNGFKFYNFNGSQDIPPYDEELAKYMDDISFVKRISFEDALDKKLIIPIPPELHDEYIDVNLQIRKKGKLRAGNYSTPIVYTPLCGTGLTTVSEILKKAGHNLIHHAPQSSFDGSFSSVPFHLPNPEVAQAAWPAVETADKAGANIILSSDPDADRLGVLSKASNGEWNHLNGNEIGVILAYYMVLDKKRGPSRKGLVIKTVVTTDLIEKIALKAGCKVIGDLLVGFKYIADVLYSIEKNGHFQKIELNIEDFILGAEESNGYLLTNKMGDKDAGGAALILADLAVSLDKEGKTLNDYLDEIAENCGSYGNGARAVLMTGIKGMNHLHKLMKSLRKSPPKSVGDRKVIKFSDFLLDERGKPLYDPDSSNGKAHDILNISLKDAKIVIRPSGTEPKVKLYSEINISGKDRNKAKKHAKELATIMYRDCLARIGPEYELSESADLIPDHIELDVKRKFDKGFNEVLLKNASMLAEKGKKEMVDWFDQNLKTYVSGNPLDALKPAIISMCRYLGKDKDEKTRTNLLNIAGKLE